MIENFNFPTGLIIMEKNFNITIWPQRVNALHIALALIQNLLAQNICPTIILISFEDEQDSICVLRSVFFSSFLGPWLASV